MEKILKVSFAELPLGVSFHAKRSLIVYKSVEGTIRAARNICKHNQGRFIPHKGKDDCYLRCPNHDWVLNASTMTYVNPLGDVKHNELICSVDEKTGILRVFEETEERCWEKNPQLRQELADFELSMTFYAHACVEIHAGGLSLFTDPWLEGPAFCRGWWLKHRPPSNWRERLSQASCIYISHNHSDHMNFHTLQELRSVNPGVLILVPAFESKSCEIPLREFGFSNVKALAFHQWFELGPNTRLMIMPDKAGRDDSGLLVEYKGHRILNLVDCANLNDGIFPQSDVLMTAFAGGASGFPVCWEEMYTTDRIAQMVERNRRLMLQHVLENVRKARPSTVVPFAGYFTEAHPSDSSISRINIKNTPEDVEDALKDVSSAYVWKPDSGVTLDVKTKKTRELTGYPKRWDPDSYEFDKYVFQINDDADFSPLDSMHGIEKYFKWANYIDNLVLHVIETDDSFEETRREFMYDFSVGKIVHERPIRSHQYTRLRVRSTVFRHILRRGLPWEDISIGFQARFYREPDVYEFKFWTHFQNGLPGLLNDGFWD